MKRTLAPEWLDELPPQDPRAERSRTDLRRVNRLMNHVRIAKGLLRGSAPGETGLSSLVDLGAGDGSFALRLVQALSARPTIRQVTLVDRNAAVDPEVERSFSALGCRVNVVREDVFVWLPQATPASLMIANLFLHHLKLAELRELFRLIATRTRVFLACEPRRCWLGLAGTLGLGLIGCNNVTRHDARISVRAGFRRRELSACWPEESGWVLTEAAAGLFSHVFLARHALSGDA